MKLKNEKVEIECRRWSLYIRATWFGELYVGKPECCYASPKVLRAIRERWEEKRRAFDAECATEGRTS